MLLTVKVWNGLPAYLRKTENGKRFVKSPGSKSGWTEVVLTK